MTAGTGRRALKKRKEIEMSDHQDTTMQTFTLAELFDMHPEDRRGDSPTPRHAGPTPRHADDRADPDRD